MILQLYCVRKAKRAGLLLKTKAASTAGLIDDAVQAVELDPDATVEHQQRAADHHFATTAETWKSLGAELNVVKTIYSSSKFIYLNRYFCKGSEVFTPMKVFARSDKEFNRRFATITSQFDTVLGSYRASVEKEACPFTAYYFAVHRCLQLASYANSSMLTVDTCLLVNSLFAPRGLGGLGIPHFLAWLTQECQDRLSMYTYTMCSIIDKVPDPYVSEVFNTLLLGTLDQEMEVVGASAIIQSPTEVRVKGVPSPEADVIRKIKRGMITRCKSEVF